MICKSKSYTEFIVETEPRSIGKTSTGRQMVEGKVNFAGQVIKKSDEVWNFKAVETEFNHKLHGFDWVDDLAALGSLEARWLAQDWLYSWIEKYSSGLGSRLDTRVNRQAVGSLGSSLFVPYARVL